MRIMVDIVVNHAGYGTESTFADMLRDCLLYTSSMYAGQVLVYTCHALFPRPITVSAIEIQGLLWQKMPAFSLYPGG